MTRAAGFLTLRAAALAGRRDAESAAGSSSAFVFFSSISSPSRLIFVAGASDGTALVAFFSGDIAGETVDARTAGVATPALGPPTAFMNAESSSVTMMTDMLSQPLPKGRFERHACISCSQMVCSAMRLRRRRRTKAATSSFVLTSQMPSQAMTIN